MEELIKIQSGLVVPKNQVNKFGGYNYRSAEDILEALKPLLEENKCYLVLSDEVVEVGGRIYVKATAKVTNGSGKSVEVSAYAREAEVQKGMSDAQITGSSSSYARKYALNGLFSIDDTRDDDSRDNTTKASKRAVTAPERKERVKATPTILDPDAPATTEQMNLVLDIAKRMGKEDMVTHDLTKGQASALIEKYKNIN